MRPKSMDLRLMAMFVGFVVASCGSPVVTPSASTSASPAPAATSSASPTPATTSSANPTPTVTASASPAPALTGRWVSAGTMALDRGFPHAILLGDGRVLVVGNDSGGSVRDDSALSEIWDPATGTWSAGPSLNKPRSDFVAVRMADGRAFVTGGVNAGVTQDGNQDRHQSYSSSFAYDPRSASAGWSRVALQDHARTSPTAAALSDGRVLVAGGYYLSGATGLIDPVVATGHVEYRPGYCGPAPCATPLTDVAPPTLIPAFATAEVYDPVSDSWSAAGSLRYARVGAPAVTLADGRVLVVGSALSAETWNYRQPKVSDRAYDTAEIYDPRTGRFSLTGDLAPVDWSPLAKLGPYPITPEGVTSIGTLVALADGGALLLGRVTTWSIRALELSGSTIRTLRFDPGTGRWSEIDQSVYSTVEADDPSPTTEIVSGHSREGELAVRMADGRVLVAGGSGVKVTDAADLYDPATNSWSALPPMPAPHRDGAAVLLADGSVLIVGGLGDAALCDACTGIPTAVRYVPGP